MMRWQALSGGRPCSLLGLLGDCTTRGKLSLEGGPSMAEQQGGEENAFLAAYLAVKGECQRGPTDYSRMLLQAMRRNEELPFTSEVRLSHALSERLSLQDYRSSYDTTPQVGRGMTCSW